MRINEQQCLNLIAAPVNGAAISAATHHEDRLVMHVEPVSDANHINTNAAFVNFLLWVKNILPPDKFKRFESLVQFPLETCDSTESVFDELSKIFNSPDKYVRAQFSVPDYEQDFMRYTAGVKFDSFWMNKALHALKTGINDFIVVDLPAQQTTEQPEPYFYILSIRNVHDVVINEVTGGVEYIIFNQQNRRKVVIDDEFYRVFSLEENGTGNWKLFSENAHSTYDNNGILIDGLGYAPVCNFYRHTIAGYGGVNKRSPITNCLSKLDWLLFWKTSKKYADLYGAWPIVVRYKEDCNYKDEWGNRCEVGYINYQFTPDPTNPDVTRPAQRRCPECEKRDLLGPGTNLSVDPPRDSTDVDLLKVGAVKFVETSNDKLEYGVNEIERLEREVFLNSCGFYHEATKEAINEKQVASQQQSRRSILDRIREQLELNQVFVLKSMARLRYGRYFTEASAFMGKEYFLIGSEEYIAKIAAAKLAGLPAYEIAALMESYSKTKFKDDLTQYQRSSILRVLEPYVDFSAKELKDMGIDLVDPKGFNLKLNFTNFVARFERENLNVVDFGSLIDFKQKISIIKQKLESYVTVYKAPASAQPNT